MIRRSLSQRQSSTSARDRKAVMKKGINFPEPEWPDTPADLAIFWSPTD
jgi:hypothetical protein